MAQFNNKHLCHISSHVKEKIGWKAVFWKQNAVLQLAWNLFLFLYFAINYGLSFLIPQIDCHQSKQPKIGKTKYTTINVSTYVAPTVFNFRNCGVN